MSDSSIDTAISLLSHSIPSLQSYCEKVIEEKITGYHIECTLKLLSKDQRDDIMKLLPLCLPPELTIPIIYDETYWTRKCIDKNWNYVHYWINDCSWRNTFICHFVENAIDSYLAKRITFEELLGSLKIFQKYLIKLKINGYKGNIVHNDHGIASQTETALFEEIVSRLFVFFPKLEEIFLNIAPAKYAACDKSDKTTSRLELIKNIFSLKNLTKLTIIGYSLTVPQMEILADHMVESLVVYLNLSCNLLTDDCCDYIAQLLKSKNLQRLILSNNCIGTAGIRKITDNLCINESLLSLDVSKNYIEDEGGVAMAELLKSNSTLQKLDISFNKLEQKSGLAFNTVVSLNKNLVYLSVSGNPMGEDIGKAFATSVHGNITLQYFGIEFCGFNEHEEDLIFKRIHKNQSGNDKGIFL